MNSGEFQYKDSHALCKAESKWKKLDPRMNYYYQTRWSINVLIEEETGRIKGIRNKESS